MFEDFGNKLAERYKLFMKQTVTILTKQDTGWIDITTILKYRVVNGIVFVQLFNGGVITLKSGDNFIGALPENLKPSREVILPIQFMGGTDKTVNPLVHSRIDTSGRVNVYLLNETKHIEGIASYPLG